MNTCLACLCSGGDLHMLLHRCGQPLRCSLCGRKSRPTIPSAALRPFFKQLATLYQPASENWDDLPALGDRFPLPRWWEGGGLWDLLDRDWKIFRKSVSRANRIRFLDEVWPGGVSTGFELSEDIRRTAYLEWTTLVSHVRRFDRSLLSQRRAPFRRRLSALEALSRSFGRRLQRLTWYRARLGGRGSEPFRPSQMGAPPPSLATGGRANAAGVPVLYLASDVHTAVSEVRAETGEPVSVAKILLSSNLRILDLARPARPIQALGCDDHKEALHTRLFLHMFSRALSVPLRRSDAPADYVPTQCVTEFIRSLNFDGILFRSSVSSGTNLVIFRPRVANATHTELAKVRKKWLDITYFSYDYGDRIPSEWARSPFEL